MAITSEAQSPYVLAIFDEGGPLRSHISIISQGDKATGYV
jgi:hypothetical protein